MDRTMQQFEVWSGMLIENTVRYGSAARRNRGSYTGSKVHRLHVGRIVKIMPGTEVKPGTMASQFSKGHETFAWVRPACGCTQGQHAGSPIRSMSAKDMNCTRC